MAELQDIARLEALPLAMEAHARAQQPRVSPVELEQLACLGAIYVLSECKLIDGAKKGKVGALEPPYALCQHMCAVAYTVGLVQNA